MAAGAKGAVGWARWQEAAGAVAWRVWARALATALWRAGTHCGRAHAAAPTFCPPLHPPPPMVYRLPSTSLTIYDVTPPPASPPRPAGHLLLKFMKEKLEDTLSITRELMKKDLEARPGTDVAVRARVCVWGGGVCVCGGVMAQGSVCQATTCNKRLELICCVTGSVLWLHLSSATAPAS